MKTALLLAALAAPLVPRGDSFSLAARPAPDDVVARVLARAEGNPFFLEELAQSVRERPGEAGALAVPGTVHDVVASRVEGLPDEDRRVLEVAAVIGREIPVALLQEASELSAADIQASLARLSSGDFLHAVRVAAQHPGPIHLLLTDVVMPGMDGCELAAGLTALLPGMKVMFMSAYDRDFLLARGLDPAGPVITKPFTVEYLSRRVRMVLADRATPAPAPVIGRSR